MRKGLFLLACVLLLGSAALPLDPDLVAAPPRATAAASPDSAAGEAPPTELSPMMAAIRAALGDEQARIESLTADLATAGGDEQAFAIQKRIERTKVETELRILRIQLDFARREGRGVTAAQLEAAIAQIEDPQLAANPQDRPGPERGAGKP